MTVKLYYVHDPMCSWCWGYRPTWLRLLEKLPESIDVVYLVGGLAPDSDLPMPAEMQEGLKHVWQRIHQDLGTEFNFDFWTKNQPRRSTYPACRAVLAAEKMGDKGLDMIEAIQAAYYIKAMNPSNLSVLIQLATEIGLEKNRFSELLKQESFEQEFNRTLEFAHQLPIAGFPSLVLETSGKYVPIKLDYKDEQVSLSDIASHIQ